MFTAANQHAFADAVAVVSDPLVAGASSLAAAATAIQTAVWGLDPGGNLFYVTCPTGSEADPTAWSTPVPLLTGVEAFAFFLNLDAGTNVLFAAIGGQTLIQLSQDPVTTDWLQRSITLPPTAVDDIAAYTSFTTHVQVVGDNGVAAANAAVAITATSPVSVYVNDVYYRLSSTVAVNTTTDLSGVLTVVQETQSLSAVCLRVVLTASPDVVADINPMANALATLSDVKTGDDLTSVQVTNADGTRQPLVPAGAQDVDSAAQSIAQFVQINDGLPADGSRQPPRLAATAAGAPPVTVFAVSYTGALEADVQVDLGSAISVAAGDLFHWLKDAFDDVEKFTIQVADGLYHFVATIAGDVYDALLDCTAAIAHAVEFVMNKIGVFLEDLIKWLGYLFSWDDILRTHAVLKNVLNCYLEKCVAGLDTIADDLKAGFSDVEKYVDAWANIPDNIPPALAPSTLSATASTATPPPGQGSPQANWGIHHLKSNADGGQTSAQPNSGVLGELDTLLAPLIAALKTEEQVLADAAASFKSDIVDAFDSLTLEALIKKLIAIIADAVLESVETVLLAAIEVLTSLVEGAIEGLNATIEIPVISSIYKDVAHADLSLLDLMCLVAAIPITVGYKLITEDAPPFPDDATSSALIAAPDWATVQQVCNGSTLALTANVATTAPSTNDIIVLSAGISSAVGSILLSIFSPLKQKFPAVKPFPIITGLSYLLYVAPDIVGQIPDLKAKKWWAITNEIIADLMVLKCSLADTGVGLTAAGSAARNLWDQPSAWIDFGANILWQVPTSAALFDPENENVAGLLAFWGGTSFDCNGILSPALADDSDPLSWGVLVALAAVFNAGYGALSLASSVLVYEGDTHSLPAAV